MLKQLFRTLTILLFVIAYETGNAQAALLDVGPTVPEVIGSTEPNLGHGFPLWYRDTNRVPLQLCTDRLSGFCLTAEPNPAAPLSFPNNLGDELFYWVGDAAITTIPNAKRALLVQAIESAFSTGNVVSGAQVTFARIRIRFDPLPEAGIYTVTTPFKQFVFNVPANALEINHTEDIGIAEGGVFTGALHGSIGPFLYCSDPLRRPAGFIGDGAPCVVSGSTYTPPGNPPNGLNFPANYFRIQGPNGFDHSTNLFSVNGKLYTDPIPTPLAAEKVTYAREVGGVQASVFAITDAMSNQKVGGPAFPGQFNLANIPSSLQLTGTDIPTLNLSTNNPRDSKFYASTDLFPLPGALPATVTLTNTADVPSTAKVVPLVDGVVVTETSYSHATHTLKVAAISQDKVNSPALEVFMIDETVLPDKKVLLGSIEGGQLSVSFPATIGGKTYNIPPSTILVTSAAGGSATAPVNVLLPPTAPIANNDAVSTPYLTPVTIDVLANDTTSGALNPATLAITAQQNGTAIIQNGTVGFTPAAAFSGAASFTYTVKDVLNQISNIATVTVTINAPLPAVTNVTVSPNLPSPHPSGTGVLFTAAAQGSSNYLFRFLLNGNEVQPFGPSATWTMSAATPPGNHQIGVEVKTNPLTASDRATTLAYQVSAVISKSPGANGTITGPATVPYGTAATFTITPSAGFHVADVQINGVSVGAVTSHTISSVIANTTVSATFSDSQIIWRNSATGQDQIWFMNGAAIAATKSFQTLNDPNWQIVGRGDFNNDARSDLLWRNVSDGQNAVWHMDGVVRTGSAIPPALADQNWKVVAVGDSNGDGKPDIYWRNYSNGQNSVWYMDGAIRTGSAYFPPTPDLNWEIVGVGDSNGDGKTDIFWRNIANGQNSVWYMDGITRIGSAILSNLTDLNWRIFGVRDYNGDRKPDLLWRNVSNGQNAIWYMDGITRTGSAQLPSLVDQNWKIVGH
ncbi:FG-GAP-like repeat-containing protein [Pelotalea chapellei]|uniref:VCBS repeat-containing protein n=1 Tax=Pelotalea chapellei TaxID=44671 RepID=A0ABS5U5Q0_9BACT|nr:FG-GAP-like repeat-containing protein [Pelotalea chapellei]MBT1070977.1 VCBS repeat-containing protein [Pelotalea chapellei]